MEFAELCQEAMAKIKVFGVGGGGGNAVNNMVRSTLNSVRFVVANTDMQALGNSLADIKIQLGQKLTKGLGAGANPMIGCEAARESIAQIQDSIGEADMVFVTAGMGGGTGTGAAPVIAQAAREMGALTVGVVTKPFPFEGKRRMMAAEAGIAELRQYVDSLITIPNARLVQLAPKNATFKDMLKKADDVLFHAVKGISDLLMVPGLINLDFADIKAAMGEAGLALMGAGVATGESRARQAALNAITSPLLEDVSIDGARGVLINVTGTSDMTMEEVSEASEIIREAAHEDAVIFFGAVFDEEAGDELRITVIATGIDNASALPEARPQNPAKAVAGLNRQAAAGLGGSGGSGGTGMGRPNVASTPVERTVLHRGGFPAGGASAYTPGGDLNLPAYERRSNPNLSLSLKPVQAAGHNPGADEFIFDEDDMEIPSFIRKQAN
ncbi:MAG: cell division protein FtsZ [Deltaproteobacteria bacterium]|jgi:cell division protein FtsZ|nr:cell division protein FtsZ [Deltaproteobacteria bacterium]